MRYLTGVLRPVERIHPVESTLANTPDVAPVAIHRTKLLDDGTCVTLLQVRGDADRLRAALSSQPSVREYALTGDHDRHVYLRTETHELARSLLTIKEEAEVVVRPPLNHTGDGGIRGTVIGTDAAFQRAVDALPDEIDLELEGIGDYHPDGRRPFSTLTDRQREILAVAVREGYYEDPRRASQGDLADRLEIAPGTVNQHLRRIEAKVFSAFVPAEEGARAT